MPVEKVPQEMMAEIWKRDEFTCRYCGKTTTWEEVQVVYDVPPEKEGKMEPSNMLTVCSQCIWEGKTGPIPEKDKRRVLSLIRELISFTSISEDVVFEEDYEQEVLNLNDKISSLKEDIGKLTLGLQEKEKMAIAFKKKMDRAYQDMENLKRRMDSDIQMRVRDGTRSVLMSMVSAIDNMDRAIIEAKKNEDVKEVVNIISGMDLIRKGMIDQMKMKGVTLMEPLSGPFDPHMHEAIGTIENKKVLQNTVVEVNQEGFLYDGQVLRPARVLVSVGGKKPPKKKREPELEEFELEEEEDENKVLELEPWNPNAEEDEFIVAKPRKKK